MLFRIIHVILSEIKVFSKHDILIDKFYDISHDNTPDIYVLFNLHFI